MMILRCNLWFKLREIKSNEICDVRPSITDILYIEKQIEAGAEICQIFDSWAGIVPKNKLYIPKK